MPRFGRKIRFSLRLSFLLLTLFCIWFGWLSSRAYNQRVAVEKIEKLGGKVRRNNDDHDYGTWYRMKTAPTAPKFVRQILGDDYFYSVISVDLTDVEETQMHEALRPIENLISIRFLDLHYQPLGDKDLSFIGKLTLIKHLDLSNSNLSDDQLANLAELNQLVTLSLSGNNISVDGIRDAMIADKSCLKMLELDDTGVTDDIFKMLNGIDDLEILSVFGTQVTTDAINNFNSSCPAVDVMRD